MLDIHIYVYLYWNNDIRIMSCIHMYQNEDSYRQLTVKAYHVFLIVLHFYMILYDICIFLHHTYEKNNTGTA